MADILAVAGRAAPDRPPKVPKFDCVGVNGDEGVFGSRCRSERSKKVSPTPSRARNVAQRPGRLAGK